MFGPHDRRALGCDEIIVTSDGVTAGPGSASGWDKVERDRRRTAADRASVGTNVRGRESDRDAMDGERTLWWTDRWDVRQGR